MPYAERHVVPIETDGAGAATVYSPVISGRVMAVRYTKGNLATTAAITISAEATGEALCSEVFTADTTRYPRVPTHTASGGVVLFGSTVTYGVNEPMVVAQDRLKVVVASGGASVAGSISFVIGT
jgi:hypothetical protein